ncbi:hypothetical protein LAZ67_12002834 [Cordylochernes scorpioides]|uniref:Uncharacterized protein n=1 Tax=Cordylochernes scorpioides TaxID=51811 RepID=A0ABY6L227_9ARAC|nr:hypothetical protein LAZ67_12002834 [Cordylochernes scorpioides]
MLKILIGPWTTLEQDLTDWNKTKTLKFPCRHLHLGDLSDLDWNKTLKFPRHLCLGDLPDLDALLAVNNFNQCPARDDQAIIHQDHHPLGRRALERPRLAAQPITGKMAPGKMGVHRRCAPPSCAFSGHNGDVGQRLALHALLHPDHPASACDSSDGSLGHPYGMEEYQAPRPGGFQQRRETPDLRAWIFRTSLKDDEKAILSSAKSRIYQRFVQNQYFSEIKETDIYENSPTDERYVNLAASGGIATMTPSIGDVKSQKIWTEILEVEDPENEDGYTVAIEQLNTDPEKIEAIVKFLTPWSITEVRIFIGPLSSTFFDLLNTSRLKICTSLRNSQKRQEILLGLR